MERCIGAFVHQGAVRVRRAGCDRGGHHDAGGAHLALDVAVLVEAPVDEVLVVGHGDMERHREPAHTANLGARVVIDMLPENRIVLFVDADRIGDRVRLALAVVQHGIEVTDLAEAVAAEFQGGRHETEAPLADVECCSAVMVFAMISVRHHHLGKRQPVGHRALATTVAVGDGVQGHPLAMVETHAQRPVLPGQLVALEGERGAVRLGDLQGLEWLAAGFGADALWDPAGHVLAHDIRRFRTAVVLDLEQLHRVEVDDTVQPADRVGVGVGPRFGPEPGVRPSEPSVPVLVRGDGVSIGPGVHEHQVEVGDPALLQGSDDIWVAPQHLVTFFELVDGEVRLYAGDVGEGFDRVLGQRDDRLVGGVARRVRAGDDALARRPRASRRVVRQSLFAGLEQLDRMEPPALGNAVVSCE